MAWYPTHRTEWTDILGLDWKIDIEHTVEPDSIITMQSTEAPLTINFLAISDDIVNVIHGSTASFSIYSDTDFQWAGLYADEDFKFRVSIYYNSTLYWRGFITSDYKEPYDGAPYAVTLFASDGLGYLKELPYKYTTTTLDDTYYTGRRLDSQVIFDILGKIGYTQFTEFINLYESDHQQTTTDSPLDQTNCDVDVFKDLDCYSVLTRMLEKYKAKIRQKNGQLIIYRPVELKEATVYGRVFTAPTAKTGTTITPSQLISRTGAVNDLRDVNGGIDVTQQPIKKVTLFQDYGNKESWIKNWDFKANTYDPSNGDWDNWTAPAVGIITDFIPEESDGLWITASSVRRDNSANQSFGDNLVTTSNALGFSFDYYLYSYVGANLYDVYIDILVRHNETNQYLEIIDEEHMGWTSVGSYVSILIPAIPNGRSGWSSFARSIPSGLPAGGSYTIKIYNPYCSTSFSFGCGFKDVKLFSTADTITKYKYKTGWAGFLWLKKWQIKSKYNDNIEIIAKEITASNAISGKNVEYYPVLGDVSDSGIDNVLEQFAGSLGRIDRDTLSEAAAAFDTAHDADYTNQSISHSGAVLNFTGTDGTDFTGASSVVNTSGSLSGSVVTSTPFSPGTAQIERIQFSSGGASGEGDISIDATSAPITYLSTIANAIDTWISNYAYLFPDYTLSRIGSDILQIEGPAGVIFTPDYNETTPSLTGYFTTYQVGTALVNRVDTITLTGTDGTANITVDGVTEEISISESIAPTVSWNTRGGSEELPLLQLVADEIAAWGARKRQLIAGYPIIENNVISNIPKIDIIGNFVDTLNTIDDEPITFVFNRGTFNVRDREWTMDLIEV